MDTKRLFNKMVRDGENGEKAIVNFLENNYEWEIEDKRADEEYQKMDVDFIGHKHGKSVKMEAKTDWSINRTGNMLFEKAIQYNEYSDKWYEGWFYKTKARYLLINDAVGGKLYVLKLTDKARKYIDRYATRRITNRMTGVYNDVSIIPVAKLIEAGVIIKVYEDESLKCSKAA